MKSRSAGHCASSRHTGVAQAVVTTLIDDNPQRMNPRNPLRRMLSCIATPLAVLGAGMLQLLPNAQAAPPVTADLALHLDASQLTGLSDGDTVETWTDMSGLDNHAVRTGGTPTYKTGIINGQPVVRFGANNDDNFLFTRISAIRSVFWVLKENSGASTDNFLLGDTSSYHFHRNGANGPLWGGNTDSNIRNGITKLMGATINGESTSLPADSFQLISLVTTGNVQANNVTKDRVYRGSLRGDIAEILIYTRDLTTEEEGQVGGYLAAKYNLTTTYEPPTPQAKISSFGPGASVGAVSGNAATISWTVPSGTDVTTLEPTFTLSNGATAYLSNPVPTPPSPFTSGTPVDFTNPVHIWVQSSDSLITNDYTVTVTVSGLPVTTGLAAWFDAAQGTTTDGSGVVTWADQTGNGHTATRAQGTMQIVSNAINGLPAVQFAGDAYAPIEGAMYSKTQFIVTKMNGGDWGAWMGSAPQSGYMWNQNGNCWDGNIPAAVAKNGTALSGYPFYLGDNRDSQYMILKIVGNDNNTSQRTYELGRAQQNWQSLNNFMAEIISFSGTLSEDDEDRIGGYLAAKYGLTTTYPPTTPSAILKRFGPVENPAVVDEANHTVDWYVPFGTDVSNLSPAYKLVYGATCDLASGSTQDFTNPVVYTVTSSDSNISQPYTVTVHELPDWPTLVNVNYSGGANGNLNGIFSFDFVARGNAASVAPANYAGSIWTDANNSGSSGSNLPDSQGNTTSIGFTTSCNNGPWGDWSALGGARISHAVVANYTTYTPVLTLNGLDPDHQYDLYVASTTNNQNKPADWQVGATVQHVENNTGESTNWVEGKNFVHFSNLIPQANGTIVVKAKGNGEYHGINLNAFQVQDMGVRSVNPEALFYEFSFGSSTGRGVTTISGTDISVLMYTGTDVSALTPTFATSGGATVTAAGNPVVSGGAVDFSGGPVHYLVTSEDTNTTTDYTVTVTLIAPSGHINVNITDHVDSGLQGPAVFNGAGKVWNSNPGQKSNANLLDEDGIATGVGFNFGNFEGTGSWGNPSLQMLHSAVYWWSQNNGGVQTGEINGLPVGKTYNLYIGTLWADSYCNGTITANGNTQNINGQGASQSAWVQGANYVEFLDVAPDVNGKIIITVNAINDGDNRLIMLDGFQLLDTGVLSPYADILTFGPGATIDQNAKTITLVAPYGTDLATFAPTFTRSGLSTCTQTSGVVPTPNFSGGPVHYIVTSEDTNTVNDYTVTVTVASPPVASGLAVWYDAGAGATAVGGVVQSWSDLSGNGRIATQGGGTVTLVPGDVNSLPAVHLRSGGFMNATTVPFTSIVKEQYVVVRSPNATWNGGGSFYGRKSDDFLSVRGSSYNMAAGTTGFWQDHFPTAVSKNGTPVPRNESGGSGFQGITPITDYMILKITVDNDGAGNIGTYPYYQIGKNETTGTMDFDVAEIMGFDHALTSVDEATVGAYLGAKYGLSAYVPFYEMLTFGPGAEIDQGTGAVTWTVPPGTDVTSLSPPYTVSIYSREDAAYPSGSTRDFSTPQTYTITSPDLTPQKTYTVTVIVGSAPPNDNYAAAISLPGTSGTQTGTGNKFGTTESGEPGIYGANNTVWFKWTAPSNGDFTVSTLGSTKVGGGEWDAMLGMYTGASVNALTALPGTPKDTFLEESMTVAVSAGITYYIQAAGFENQVATNILLTWSFVSSGSDYDTWGGPSGYNLTGGIDDDDDGDSMSNRQEYAFGLNPTSGASVSPITVQLDPEAGTFTYTRRDPSLTGLGYSVWTSTDLGTWTMDGDAIEGVITTDGNDVQTVPVTLSAAALATAVDGTLFVRVQAD